MLNQLRQRFESCQNKSLNLAEKKGLPSIEEEAYTMQEQTTTTKKSILPFKNQKQQNNKRKGDVKENA